MNKKEFVSSMSELNRRIDYIEECKDKLKTQYLEPTRLKNGRKVLLLVRGKYGFITKLNVDDDGDIHFDLLSVKKDGTASQGRFDYYIRPEEVQLGQEGEEEHEG